MDWWLEQRIEGGKGERKGIREDFVYKVNETEGMEIVVGFWGNPHEQKKEGGECRFLALFFIKVLIKLAK